MDRYFASTNISGTASSKGTGNNNNGTEPVSIVLMVINIAGKRDMSIVLQLKEKLFLLNSASIDFATHIESNIAIVKDA